MVQVWFFLLFGGHIFQIPRCTYPMQTLLFHSGAWVETVSEPAFSHFKCFCERCCVTAANTARHFRNKMKFKPWQNRENSQEESGLKFFFETWIWTCTVCACVREKGSGCVEEHVSLINFRSWPVLSVVELAKWKWTQCPCATDLSWFLSESCK